jgi:PAS domain S-box-containing protein
VSHLFSGAAMVVCENILEYIFNSGTSSLIVIDKNKTICLFNKQAESTARDLFDSNIEIGIPVSRIINPDEHPEFYSAFDDFDRGTVPLPVVSIKRSGEDEQWYETSFLKLRDANDSLLLSTSDITMRKQTFDRLTESERRFKALMTHSPGITAVISESGIISFISDSVEGFLGYSVAECRGMDMADIIHHIDRANFKVLLAELLKSGGQPLTAELQFVGKTGDVLYFDIKGSNQLKNPVVHGIILNLHDYTERKHIDEMIRRIAYQNEMILETASEGIFGVNIQGSLTFVNPYAALMLRYHEEELIGKKFSVFAGDDSLLSDALEKKEPVHSVEARFREKSGSSFPVEFSATPIFDRGVRTGSVVTFNDISHRKRIEEELIFAKDSAEQANRAKSDFLATMSHEIRTPLNSIMGFLDLISPDKLDETQREYVSIALSNTKNLVTIINDILDLSKIEKGKLELESIPFDPVAKLSPVVRLFDAKAREKKITLIFSHDNPPVCEGDSLRIGQIITNLIGNAVKFTPEGGTIFVGLKTNTVNDNAEITVEVKDTGIGIHKDHLKKVFESFTQSDSSISRKYGGTGLGLSISSRLVAMMGGSLNVESEPGKGTRFFFTIMLPVSDSVVVFEKDSVMSRMPFFNLKALVAEDTPDSSKLISIMLERIGITSDLVSDGAFALEKIKSEHYDIVFMDGNMPDMDGVSASREIRAYESLNKKKRTPIVALSAKALLGDQREFMHAGADAFVIKPVTMSELVRAVSGIFPDAGNTRDTGMDGLYPEVNDFPTRLALALGLGNGSAMKLFSEFVKTLPDYAMLVETSAASGNENEIIMSAHRLKGISATYLLEDLARLCGELEDMPSEKRPVKQSQLIEQIRIETERVISRFNSGLFPL